MLLLFSHHYFSLPAFPPKYTSYCAYFLLFFLPICVLFPVQYLNLIFSDEAVQIPLDGQISCSDSLGGFHIGLVELRVGDLTCGAVCVYTDVQPFTPSGFRMSEWQKRVNGRACVSSVAELGRGEPWPTWQFSAMEGDFLGSTFPVRLALSALSCCITAHPQGQPLSDQMALCLPGTS